jgi:hypothetical protein
MNDYAIKIKKLSEEYAHAYAFAKTSSELILARKQLHDAIDVYVANQAVQADIDAAYNAEPAAWISANALRGLDDARKCGWDEVNYTAAIVSSRDFTLGNKAIPLYTHPLHTSDNDAHDAARYRYLRESCGEFVRYAGAGDHWLLEEGKLDTAVDTAMAKNTGV